jgi:hypothetical protein
VLEFWRNPEFVRHARAELRPARAVTAAVVAMVICVLVGLTCWSSEHENVRVFFRTFYAWLVGMQFVVLGVWSAAACGQAISRERELKTYDFLKTTRLTSTELMVGKILGVPVLAYFVVACSIPVSVLSGILGGFSLRVLAGTYVLLLVFALFFSLVGLWGSMLMEKSNVGAIGLLGLLPNGIALGFVDSSFPGFGALSVFPAIFSLHGLKEMEVARVTPSVFGVQVPFFFLTIFLYVVFGAWFALMLARNLKKDLEQIRLLSRWQAVGFVAFLNVLFFAFLDPRRVLTEVKWGMTSPQQVSVLVVGLNAAILFIIGVATLTSHERLKVWWRRWTAGEESYLAEYGLPWPWLVPAAAIAYALLAAEALGMLRVLPLKEWQLGRGAVQLLVFLIFTTRDVMFLQWCALTRMKRPIVKGFLYLWLYYTAVGVSALVASIVSTSGNRYIVALLTPYGMFNSQEVWPRFAPEICLGMVLQVGVIVFILKVITKRLQRPALVPASSAV